MIHLEFQNGELVKIHGHRPEYMDGSSLIRHVKAIAKDMNDLRDRMQGEIDDIAMNLGQSLLDNAALSRGFETYGWSMQFTCPATGRKGSPSITLDPEEARDMMARDNWTVTELFALKAPRTADPASRCEHCDNTGDVHRPDGEWMGECNCQAGRPLAPETWEGSDAHPEGGAA